MFLQGHLLAILLIFRLCDCRCTIIVTYILPYNISRVDFFFPFSLFPGRRIERASSAPVETDQATEAGEATAENRQVFAVRRHDPHPVNAPVHVGRPLVRVHLVRDRRQRAPFARENLGFG